MTDNQITGNLFLYFAIVATIIFFLVVFFVTFYTRKYREKGKVPAQDGGSEKFEVLMLALATGLTIFFLVLTFSAMKDIQTIPENPKPDLELTGHQWWWEARYPESGVITANEIHIPVGKKILLKLNSADVIHSWWVPELGRKMDMIPGMDNYMWLYAKEEGEFVGSCSEFCGTQHARMRIRVIAQSEKGFTAWKKQQLQPVATSSDLLFEKGKKLFEERTCTNCHAINGTVHMANIGPNLTHFAGRKRFLADMKDNTEGNLRAWLKDPQQVKSGAKMPNFIFSDDDLDALVAYINRLK